MRCVTKLHLYPNPNLTPLPICLPFTIIGIVESKCDTDLHLNNPLKTHREVLMRLCSTCVCFFYA